MGRRSDHDRQELNNLILHATEKLVAKNGFSSLTSRKIASEIGYTVGTLYNVFANLDDIILHVNGRTLDAMYVKMHNAKNFKALAKTYFQFAEKETHLWKMLYEYPLFLNKTPPKWYREKVDRMFDHAERLLLSNQKLSPKAIKRSARTLWAGVHGICILSLSNHKTVDAEPAPTLINSLIDNYLKGLSYD